MIRSSQKVRAINTAGGLRAMASNPNVQRRSGSFASALSGRAEEVANFGGGSMYGQARNGTVTNALPQSGILYDTLLNNLIGENEMTNVRFYRDIYHYDAVGGSTVDLMSNMPFSDFQLLGCDDKRLDVYNEAIARLDMKTYLPEATIDYLVTGLNCATLVYNSKLKAFVDYIPWRMEDCRIHNTPFRNVDPVIEVRPPDHYKAFLSSDSEQFRRLKQELNPKLLQAFDAETIKLDPLTTIFLPRKTYTYSQHGTSLYRRILPLYFLEKTLYRGTLVETMRRQRALLHLQMGDDIWEPTPEEMQAIVALFMEADMDPLGAVVGTRQGVQLNEARQGGDFWKYTDIIDATSALKLRALGISETFLSADANYATAETGLTVFTENIRGYRDNVTHKIFYTKLLPLIASMNEFYKDAKGNELDRSGAKKEKDKEKELSMLLARYEASRRRREMGSAGSYNISLQHRMNDNHNFDLPTIHWSKSLRPAADQQTLEILGTLKDKGLPIPLTMLAAAGGMNIDNLIRDLQEDEEIKAKIKQITGKDPDQMAQGEDGEGLGDAMAQFGNDGGGNGMGNTEASLMADVIRTVSKRRRRALLSRNFDSTEYQGTTRTGKPRYIYRQNVERDRQYDNLAKAIKNMSDPHNYQTVLSKAVRRMGGLPSMYGEIGDAPGGY